MKNKSGQKKWNLQLWAAYLTKWWNYYDRNNNWKLFHKMLLIFAALMLIFWQFTVNKFWHFPTFITEKSLKNLFYCHQHASILTNTTKGMSITYYYYWWREKTNIFWMCKQCTVYCALIVQHYAPTIKWKFHSNFVVHSRNK